MYNEVETYMMEIVERTLEARAKRRKDNIIFYLILCAVVFFTVFLSAYAMR